MNTHISLVIILKDLFFYNKNTSHKFEIAQIFKKMISEPFYRVTDAFEETFSDCLLRKMAHQKYST